MNERNPDIYPKIRVLTRKDRKELTDLLKQYVKRPGNEKLAEMVPGNNKPETEDPKTKETQTYELIKSVMENLLQWFEEDVTKFFMRITDTQTIEEFDKMPFDIEIHILDECLKQKAFNNFFTRALDWYKKIQG